MCLQFRALKFGVKKILTPIYKQPVVDQWEKLGLLVTGVRVRVGTRTRVVMGGRCANRCCLGPMTSICPRGSLTNGAGCFETGVELTSSKSCLENGGLLTNMGVADKWGVELKKGLSSDFRSLQSGLFLSPGGGCLAGTRPRVVGYHRGGGGGS